MDEIIEVGGGAWHRAADFVGCFPRLPMGTGARIIQNAFSPHPLTKALTDIKSVDGVTRQSAKHQHQEAELDPLQPANPWQGGNRKRSGMLR